MPLGHRITNVFSILFYERLRLPVHEIVLFIWCNSQQLMERSEFLVHCDKLGVINLWLIKKTFSPIELLNCVESIGQVVF